MKRKILIEPRLKRRIPAHFTWVDHKLVRNGHIRKCSIGALGFYLFLVAVSDCDGLSFYGDKRIALELNIPEDAVISMRMELVSRRLIAYQDGIYQLLNLQEDDPEHRISSTHSPYQGICHAGDIASKIIGGLKNG